MERYKEKFEEIYHKPGDAPWTFEEPHPEIVALVKYKVIQGKKILEIGCGEGNHAIYLASKGFDVTAIDNSENAIKFSKENAQKANVKCDFRVLSYNNLNKLEGDKFDFIFDWRFLHEITDEEERKNYAKEIKRLLKQGGKYLSVAFSGETDYWGTGKLRKSPVGITIYFATLKNLETLFSPYLTIIEKRLIKVPQKPNLDVDAYYLLASKQSTDYLLQNPTHSQELH